MNSCIFRSVGGDYQEPRRRQVGLRFYAASRIWAYLVPIQTGTSPGPRVLTRSVARSIERISVTFTIDTMIRLLRIANITMLFLYVLGSSIRVSSEVSRLSKGSPVPLIAFLIVASLVFALHVLSLSYAWRGLGSTSTLKVVQSAWRLNIALVLFSLYQIVSSLLDKTEDFLSNPLLTLVVALNVVALGRRKSILKATPATQGTGIPSAE